MTTIPVPLSRPGVARPPDRGPSQDTVERTRRVRFGRGGVRRERARGVPCPNRAAVVVRGRAYCRQHASARAAGDRTPEATR